MASLHWPGWPAAQPLPFPSALPAAAAAGAPGTRPGCRPRARSGFQEAGGEAFQSSLAVAAAAAPREPSRPAAAPLPSSSSRSQRLGIRAEDEERARTDRPRGATRTCGTDGAGGGARPPPLGRGQPCAPRAWRGGTGGAAASQPHLTLAAARAGGRRRGPSGSRAAHEVSPSRIGAAHLRLCIAHPRDTQRRCCGAGLGEGTPTEIQRQVSPRMVRLSKLMGMTLASRVLCWS